MGAALALKRPTDKQVRSFKPWHVGDDTIRDFLVKGFSLAICCQDCPRLVEWTPPDLQERFGDRLGLRIADLVPRLSCSGEAGCGSQRVAVFPHFYEGRWVWSHS